MDVEFGGTAARAPSGGAAQVFSFRDCRLTVKTKGGSRALLKGVTGEARSGEVLAIMGPSGAGKTCLINMLTLTTGPGIASGDVMLNGRPFTRSMFVQLAGEVAQHDNHWAFLTCRETVQLAVDLMDLSEEERKMRADDILKRTGLEGCADTRVGNMFIPGLSGGQKRRLSLATILLRRPGVNLVPRDTSSASPARFVLHWRLNQSRLRSRGNPSALAAPHLVPNAGTVGGIRRDGTSVLAMLTPCAALVFLDEPTSGLDAAAAFHIVNFVGELARDMNIIVVCTIHQPSATVYQSFASTLLLSDGRVAYMGPAAKLQAYLELIKHPLPPAMGVAEYVLDLVNREFTDPKEVDKLLNTWENNSKEWSGSLPTLAVSEDLAATLGKRSALRELAVLVKRQAILTIRDPTIYLGRALVNLVTTVFFATVYLNSSKYNQKDAAYHLFLTMWYCGVPACMGTIAVFAFNIEYKSIKAEVKNGMYSASSYLLSRFVLEIPMMVLLSIFAISAGAFGVSEFNGDYYFTFLCVYTVMLWSFECAAQAMSVAVDNPLIGALGFMNVWFCSFLFAGVMVPQEDVPWPFRALVYVFPLRYSLSAMLYVNLHDVNFDGAVLDENDPRGFSCPTYDGVCFGATGKQVLSSLGQTYRSLGPEDTVLRDTMCLLAIAVFWKVQYIALLLYKASAHRIPKPAVAA